MRTFHAVRSWLLLALLFTTNLALAENWPGWRGPRGDGTSLEQNLPLQWDGAIGKNIVWKSAIPGQGHGSPIVWNDDVFLVSSLPDSLDRLLICLDRKSGQLRWKQTVVKSPLETKHQLNSYASCTPATDGELVYVAFFEGDGSTVTATNVSAPRPVSIGRMVVAAYNFAGEQQWLVKPGGFISVHGFCSNPVLVGDLVIVNGDHDGDSYIVALHKDTGETVWKQPRIHKTRSYCTPIVRDVAGKLQLVFSGNHSIVSLDPRTGEPHWTIKGPTEQFVASMVFDGSRFFMSAGFPDYHVMAIKPDGTGDVTKTHIAWHATNAKCYVPSPVLAGEYLLVADDRGTANCFRAATGERLWQERLGTHYSASLASIGGRAFFLDDDGEVKLVEPGAALKVVAENKLGEPCYASPAFSQGQIFIRSEQSLFCIGEQQKEITTKPGTRSR